MGRLGPPRGQVESWAFPSHPPSLFRVTDKTVVRVNNYKELTYKDMVT